MKYLGRFFALLAAFIFVVTLPCAIWSIATRELMSDADIYKDALANNDGYRNIIPAVLPAMAEEGQHANLELEDPEAVTFLQIIENLDEEDWRMIAEDLVPPEWLQTQFEDNIDGFFAWLNDETPTPEIRFASGDLRERLEGPPGQRAVNLIMASWPDCTAEELDILLTLDVDDETMPFCQPPGEYAAFVSEALTDILRQGAQQLPDTLPEEDWLHDPKTRENLTGIKFAVRIGEATITELWLFCLAMLALIVTFTVRSLKSFLRWTGITALSGAILTLLPVPLLLSPLLLPPAISGMLTEGTPTPGGSPPLPPGTNYGEIIIYDLTRAIVSEVTVPVIILSIIVIGIAFVALLVSAFLRYPEQKLAEALAVGTVTPTPTPVSTYATMGQVTPTPGAIPDHTAPETKTPPPSQTAGRSTADPFAPPDLSE